MSDAGVEPPNIPREGEHAVPRNPSPNPEEHHAPEQNTEQTVQSEIIRVCASTVEEYQRDEIPKPVAVSRIGAQLSRGDAGLSVAQANTALTAYLDMLADHDREREQREPGARDAPEGGDPGGEQGSSRDQGAVPLSRGHASPKARSHIEIEESRGGSPTDGEPSVKRSKLDTSSFPWSQFDEELSVGLVPELQESLKLHRIYATDIKGTKLHLVNSVGAPEFPDSEWNNILLGRAVDLDRVFTGHYAASTEEPQSESVGELEIRFKPASPAKRITASGEWVLSWNKASAVTTYAFPHRRAELAAYGDYIVGLFGALAVPLHHQLLEFDRAVRKRVGSRRDLLTDYVRFADLKIQFLDSAGANVYNTQENRTGGAAGGVRSGARRQKEACKRWNAGNCPSLASECRYKHVCSSCGAGGHTKLQCTKAQNGPA